MLFDLLSSSPKGSQTITWYTSYCITTNRFVFVFCLRLKIDAILYRLHLKIDTIPNWLNSNDKSKYFIEQRETIHSYPRTIQTSFNVSANIWQIYLLIVWKYGPISIVRIHIPFHFDLRCCLFFVFFSIFVYLHTISLQIAHFAQFFDLLCTCEILYAEFLFIRIEEWN